MAQRHPDSAPAVIAPVADRTAGEVLAGYLGEHAAEFLRGLRLRADDEAAGARALRRSSRRISAVLLTYEPLVDPGWAQSLRSELRWLCGTLAREQRYGADLGRLRTALHRLVSGTPGVDNDAAGPPADGAPEAGEPVAAGDGPGRRGTGRAATAPAPSAEGGGRRAGRRGRVLPASSHAPPTAEAADQPPGRGPLAVGAARAGALLERQLTLSRTRAHSATLQAFGSARFHAVADTVALLASDPPLTAAAAAPADQLLPPLAEHAYRRLAEAVEALPLALTGYPYNGHALRAALADAPADEQQDLPWHQVRGLLRVCRYALEPLDEPPAAVPEAARLYGAGRALDRHRDAAAAAAAAASAARTPRITPATGYALGVLHADQRAEVEAARYAFSRMWLGIAPVG
ncbi:CHAD domain-containing protein [Streptantibioticus rubrisoli]|uniref:CHAD domain-containing protein n=1 Tax=Streptantibioticus rubrisoli TaxID=1387313 RepID=A0ABT1PKU8_9ACTN|nr:CHAD domain-containing protein [Streptantibioticus rubrisoli]MCQ4045994.1 CHAD domain-containing protein [Streptantibioticus rubrisoli]